MCPGRIRLVIGDMRSRTTTSMTPNNQTPIRTWFITGASGGFGRALCDAVVARGDRLVATSRDIRELERAYPDALALELDVTNAGAARAAVRRAVAELGSIDVVVNNAGYGHFGAVEELTDDEVRQQMEVNFFGLLNVTRAALPGLRRQRSGHIVQMSSLNGVVGMVGGGYYVASKFAVEGVSESLADEVAPLGIRVTIVEPGPHRTNFAGRGARLAEPIDDYAETVGAAREAFADLDGQQPGDPRRGAEAIAQAVDAPDPPLRLPLGDLAVSAIRTKLEAQLGDLRRSNVVSASTSFTAG
jgi:NAD(P)-dependent dehydrogenase (short-subunit alcohol dehydrogenase family)